MSKNRIRRDQVTPQLELNFPEHGGARRGAGRKPKHGRAGPSHTKRAPHKRRFPLLVTQRLRAGLPSLRRTAVLELLRTVFAESSERVGFRLVHFSIQSNHLHCVCEALDTPRLTSGMRSLGVKIARRLNQLWQRRGPVFADRFHARELKTPNEVHRALGYVLNNAFKHGICFEGPDPFSSGAWFDGWSIDTKSARIAAIDVTHFAIALVGVAHVDGADLGSAGIEGPDSGHAHFDRAHFEQLTPASNAETWLLRVGWKLCGLIEANTVPGSKSAAIANAKEEGRLVLLVQRRLEQSARERLTRGVHTRTSQRKHEHRPSSNSSPDAPLELLSMSNADVASQHARWRPKRRHE